MLEHTRAVGLIAPCLPSPAKTPPVGPDFLHEIIARRLPHPGAAARAGVRLITRNGHDFTKRFPLVAAD
jgi:bifunctional non-homologous end joining protein LigD